MRFALEVGFGGGEHLAEQARRNPDTGYIGCEPFENGVAKLLTQVQASRLRNVRVVPDDARDILVRLPDASLSFVFVLFPDPWPKLRHYKRRFIQTRTLDQIHRLLKPGGELRIATDHTDYGQWALMHLMRDNRFSNGLQRVRPIGASVLKTGSRHATSRKRSKQEEAAFTSDFSGRSWRFGCFCTWN
jgi:tRNA (guanine-N7-)-methyltransferase